MRTPSVFTIALCAFAGGLVLGITTISVGAGTRGSDRFPDVFAGAYFDDAVGEMAELGVIRGRPDGRFDPGAFATRAEIAVMFQRFRESMQGVTFSSSTSSRPSRPSRTSTSSSISSSSSVITPRNPAGSIRFTIDRFSVEEDKGPAKLTLIRAGGGEGIVSVQYRMKDGTAQGGLDYVDEIKELTFAKGETSRIFFVDIIDDGDDEGNHKFTIELFGPEGGATVGVPSEATITIEDDDSVSAGDDTSTITFSAGAYSVNEDGESLTVTVERRGSNDAAASVQYATSDITARAGIDYDATSGTLNFAVGETQKTFVVTVDDDQTTEGNEKLDLTLSSFVGALPGTFTEVEFTIVDNEVLSFGAGSLKLGADTYDVLESAGVLSIPVLRTGGGDGDIEVRYETHNGTAKFEEDYEKTEGTLLFRHGETEKRIEISIIDDERNDPNETFRFELSAPTGGADLKEPKTATIIIRQ